MHSFTFVATLGAFLASAAAVPMKRELIVNTVTEVEVVTEMLTATVWVDATGAPASYHEAHYTQGPWEHHTSAAVVTTQAQPTTTSSVYVAPPRPTTTSTTSSTSTSSTSTAAAQVYTAPPQPAPPVQTTTSVYVAPAPITTSTSEYVAPVYTPAPSPTTTSTTAPAPVTTSSGGSSGQYSGDITYYGVGLGSCGETNTDSEMVVAMAHGMMNKATMCGKTITMSYQGVTKQAKVVDTCMSCVDGDLDLSPALFKAIAPNGDGRVHGVSWSFN